MPASPAGAAGPIGSVPLSLHRCPFSPVDSQPLLSQADHPDRVEHGCLGGLSRKCLFCLHALRRFENFSSEFGAFEALENYYSIPFPLAEAWPRDASFLAMGA